MGARSENCHFNNVKQDHSLLPHTGAPWISHIDPPLLPHLDDGE